MIKMIDLFVELGLRLENFGSDERSKEVIAQAIEQNRWFNEQGVLCAIDAIRTQMLDEQKLRVWYDGYSEAAKNSTKKVLVIAAGNIPAVSFFDILCVLCAGHSLYLKPSSKDRALTLFFMELILEIEPAIPIYIYNGEKIDALIATGGESANLFFKANYGEIPSLLRGNRSSVAILNGNESEEDINLLINDIYKYSGLGCRNISMIFTPKESKIELPKVETTPPYHNNYLQNRALAAMSGQKFIDTGYSVLKFQKEFPTELSTISVFEYESEEEVKKWLKEHEEQIQCVASRSISHPRQVDFGQAQTPTLNDYPDSIDTMKFLRQIQ